MAKKKVLILSPLPEDAAKMLIALAGKCSATHYNVARERVEQA